MGVLSLPSERFTRFGNPAWPGLRTANLAAFGPWPGVLSKNAESLRNSDALMRVAVPRRRGPAGLRGLFSFLTKLRLVRPIPETSFSSPDAPACAVPAQAAFPLALSRLGAVQGFSVLSLCLTPFLDFEDKKRPLTIRIVRPVNGLIFGIRFLCFSFLGDRWESFRFLILGRVLESRAVEKSWAVFPCIAHKHFP